MAKDNNMSNTQEINSILEEARKYRTPAQTQQPAPKKAAPQSGRYRQAPANDGYVDISAAASRGGYTDINKVAASNGKKPKKKGKAGLIIGIIVGVIVLAGIGGFTWYMLSGSSTFAKNVSVNGVSLAGMTRDEAKQALASEEQKLADKINIVVKSDDKSVTLTKDDFEYSYDTDSILDDAQAYSEEKGLKTGERTYTISMSLSEDSCKAAAEKVAGEINAKAKNAKVTEYDSKGDGSFTFQDEVNGVTLQEDKLTEDLQEMVKNGTVDGSLDAPTEVVEPKYTVDYLKKNITKLSSFTTTSTNNSNGNTNMEVSLKACNNSIIDPGEVWSFNDCTGDSNQESNGYKPAGVIVEGRHEVGIGGGICQSSTTIYNAALLCGMEVEERACHYYKSVYVDAGRDATIDYGNIDLKLKNPFEYQLFMKCYMDGTVLHCEMYGIQTDEFDDVEISTETTSYFSTGYRVAATRTFLKNGKVVRSDDLPESTYYTVEPKSSRSSSNDNNDNNSASSSGGGSTSSQAPEPDPQPQPEPEPEPQPEPEPEPQPDPQPEPEVVEVP